jgi:hypothetical protein
VLCHSGVNFHQLSLLIFTLNAFLKLEQYYPGVVYFHLLRRFFLSARLKTPIIFAQSPGKNERIFLDAPAALRQEMETRLDLLIYRDDFLPPWWHKAFQLAIILPQDKSNS